MRCDRVWDVVTRQRLLVTRMSSQVSRHHYGATLFPTFALEPPRETRPEFRPEIRPGFRTGPGGFRAMLLACVFFAKHEFAKREFAKPTTVSLSRPPLRAVSIPGGGCRAGPPRRRPQNLQAGCCPLVATSLCSFQPVQLPAYMTVHVDGCLPRLQGLRALHSALCA